uniref:Pr1-like protein n=1 Tax=Oryza nivara TaxID=4536 RepID=A0A679BDE6_ORYNI|nr:pr1-like protein [Oryza sativa f. spontanea]
MWKYGSALQQRPELNPYSGRGATSHNWHAPKPHQKRVLGVLKEEERSGREGARGPGPREWGPRVSLSVHGGPGARGWRRSAPWVPRVSRTRGRGRLTAGPHLAAAGRARRRPRRHGRREAARPRPDGHRRRPSARRSSARESREEGETEGTVHGSPRDNEDGGNDGRSGETRRRGSG